MNADEIVKSAELLKEAFLNVSATMAMANGKLDETEIEAIAGFCSRFTGDPIGSHQIIELAHSANSGKIPLSAYLESVKGEFPDETKELLIQAAYNVAIADGEFCDKEKSILIDIAMALGFDDERRDAMLEKLRNEEMTEKKSGEALVKDALIKTMTSMVMVDDRLRVSEIDILAVIYRRFTGKAVGVDEIDEIALSVAEDSLFHLPHFLTSIEKRLDSEKKENLIRAAVCAAKSDEELVNPEIQLLEKIAKALRIPDARLQELISEKGAL